MHINLDSIIGWMIQYRYFLVFPLAVAEGPIVTILTGLLSSLGIMNFWAGYAVVVAGDLVGDSIFYAIGRFGRTRFIYKYGRYIGLHPERLSQVEHFIRTNINKVFIFGKFAHGTGSILWVGTGVTKIPYGKFLLANTVTTCIKSFILIILGYYFGQAYQTFDLYLRNLSLLFLGALFVAYLVFIRTKIHDNLKNT